MTILDTFYLLFESDTSKLDKGLGETDKKAVSLIDKLKQIDVGGAKAGEGLYQLVGKAAGLLGVGASIGALVAGVKETAQAYDELGKLATRFRSTAEAVDEFRDAAGLLDIAEETSVGALKALDSAVQDTFLGLGRAGKIFEEIGVNVTDAAGQIKPTTQVMAELADKLKGMEKGTQIRVMERLGLDPSLLKLFNADFAVLQKRMADVDKASGFNLERAVKRATEYTKASKALSLEINVLKMYVEKLVEGFKVAALPVFTTALETATKYVKLFADYLMKHTHLVEGFFIAVGGAIAYFLIPAAISGAVAVWAMIAPFALIGLAAVAAAAAFALLYDDVMNFLEGGDSLIGQALEKWPVLGEIAEEVAGAFRDLWAVGQQVFEFFSDVWRDPAAAFSAFLDLILGGLKELLSKIPGVASAMQLLGFGGDTSEAVSAGKSALGQASGAGLSAQTSNSLATSILGGKSTSVQVGKVEVHTQATDAQGISKAIGGTMQTQMRQAVNNFDDGVLA
jgi:hypothetical protein